MFGRFYRWVLAGIMEVLSSFELDFHKSGGGSCYWCCCKAVAFEQLGGLL